MGILSISYSTFVANYFQNYILDSHRQQLISLAEIEVHYLRDKVVAESVNLGMSVQSGFELRNAIKHRNDKKTVALLDQHFHRAFVTLGILELEKIIVYNKKLEYINASSEGTDFTSLDGICPGIIQELKLRKSIKAMKPLSRICSFKDSIHLISVVPIGGLRVTGYLAVVVNPLRNLSLSEKGMGIPLKIISINNTTLYQSSDWPDKNIMENILIAKYGFKAGNISPISYFMFAFNIVELQQHLNEIRKNILSLVSIFTLFIVLVSLFVFQRSILSPLKRLSLQLHRVKQDKNFLGKEIKISGSKEVHELANNFNDMSRELKGMYSKLENMAFTDSLTGIPNRASLLDRLQHITSLSQRKNDTSNFIFMLLDLNRFKKVNDTYGHIIGDKLLQLVAKRIESTIRESDTVARLGGDEFAVILKGISEEKIIIERANKITSVMSEPIVIDGQALDIGLSIGISRYPEDGSTSQSIINCADKAMYYSKKHQLPYSFYSSE